MLNCSIDPKVLGCWSGEAVLAICSFEGCTNRFQDVKRFESRLTSEIAKIRTVGRAVLEQPRFHRMRETFRAMPDMDPARYRPASESLTRRLLEKDLFRINPLVDINNLLSVQTCTPLGIYDLTKVQSHNWSYRLGDKDETYVSISGQIKNATGKLIISDSEGPIGSPVADSGRAPVSETTTDFTIIAYFPFDTFISEAEQIINDIEMEFSHQLNSNCKQKAII